MVIRAEKNQMNLKEFVGGFLYFSPSGGTTLLEKFFDESYYKRWIRSEDSAFHNNFMKENGYIKNRLKSKNLESSDKNLFKESLYSFIEKPLKHFFTSILFFYRGLWPDATDRFSLYYAFLV